MSALTVSTDEAAELLGCSAQRIRDQVRRGAIPKVFDTDGPLLIPRAWIERQCQVAPSVPPALVAELAEIAAARAALDARQQALTAQLLRIAQGDTP